MKRSTTMNQSSPELVSNQRRCAGPFRRRLLSALVPGLMTLCSVPYAIAQDNDEAPTQDELEYGFELEAVIVTGYRQSLESASSLKRESTNIVDSVFAEDIGKFPDLNIAEALNRVPGIQLTRQVDGTGLNVAIRGLNTNFTKTTLNGAPIAVASSGRLDSTNGNREVDLDIFPIEFFSQLEVKKTSVASMLEGGVAGTVNIRTSRPFDSTGNNMAFDLQGIYGELSEKVTPRGSFTANWKNGSDTFGVLFGLAGVNNNIVTEGYETTGWTSAQLTYDQCGVAFPSDAYPGSPVIPGSGFYDQCNGGGGDGYIIGFPVEIGLNGETIDDPGYHVLPSNISITGNSGTVYGPGTRIDNAVLLDINPGLSTRQISDGLMPLNSRPHYSEGDRERLATLLSLQFLPNERIDAHLDILHATNTRDFNRLDMALAARNAHMVPANMQVDDNGVITSADFYNAQFLLQARPYEEELDFYNINPGASFDLSDNLLLDVELNVSESTWEREAPTVALITNPDSGVAVHYELDSDNGPVLTPNVDLDNPDQVAGWGWQYAYIQNEERETKSNQFRTRLRWGDEVDNVVFGIETHQAERIMEAFDGSYSWEQYTVYGDGNTPPAVPSSVVSDYLIPGPDGYVTVDYDRLFAASDYERFNENAGLVPTSATAARTGAIDEDTTSAYVEYNHEFYAATRPLKINAGLRYVKTDHEVTVPTNFGFNRDIQYVSNDSSYSEVLPSFNISWEFQDGLIVRGAVSKTLSRANPTRMLPSTIFVDPSAQYASRGNPDLEPFTALNIDLGFEWYTDKEGYVALNLFHKNIEGFVTEDGEPISFLDLGIGFDFLSTDQQDAIEQRGGPDTASVILNTPVNADGDLTIEGAELSWTQPLDNLLDGLGYSVNYTHVEQSSSGDGVPTFATYVSENTANFTAYYEQGGFSARASYVWYDEQLASGVGYTNVPFAQLKVEARGQWDLSASYEFEYVQASPAITLNIVNLGGDPQRQNFEFDNAPFFVYDPGMTVMLGVRGKLQ